MEKVSIVIPYKKENAGLKKILYSVLNQNFQDFKIVIITDYNIEQTTNDSRIKYIKLPQEKNIPELLNKSINYVDTELVCFLNPNDLLLYNALKLRYEKFLEDPSLMVCYGLGLDTDLEYQVKCTKNYEFLYVNALLPENNLKSLLLDKFAPTESSIMLKTEVLNHINFNKNLKINYSWEFFIRLLQCYDNKIFRLKNAIYISKNEEAYIKQYKKSFFVKHLKETTDILDNFFNQVEINSELMELKYSIYKENYSRSFSLLIEYFPKDYWLRLYILASYIRKNTQFGNAQLDLCFLSALINSLLVIREPLENL